MEEEKPFEFTPEQKAIRAIKMSKALRAYMKAEEVVMSKNFDENVRSSQLMYEFEEELKKRNAKVPNVEKLPSPSEANNLKNTNHLLFKNRLLDRIAIVFTFIGFFVIVLVGIMNWIAVILVAFSTPIAIILLSIILDSLKSQKNHKEKVFH